MEAADRTQAPAGRAVSAPVVVALLRGPDVQRVRWRAGVVACALLLTLATSSAAQWTPLVDVMAFVALEVVVDLFTLKTRNLAISSGSTVLVAIMALFGPAPAVLAGCISMAIDAVRRHVRPVMAMSNLAVFTVLPLVGGLGFQLVRDRLDLEPADFGYACVVAGGFVVIEVLNFLLIGVLTAEYRRSAGRRLYATTSLALVPWHVGSALIAGAAVLAYGRLGLVSVALLAGMLLVSTPLLGSVVVALQRLDAMSELQATSDARAAEVARLSSDRARLLDEALLVAEQERERLAESLHDGPLQRLLLLGQDLAERPEEGLERARADLDAAVHETRAVVAAYHPVASTELGFEAAVRAAAFMRDSVALEFRLAAGDARLADATLRSVARELVTNAVKHARPSLVRVAVAAEAAGVTLEVTDDGQGIDARQAESAVQAGHVGLAVARRRVEAAGGTLEIRTVPSGGTHVRVVLPAPVADAG